MKARRVGKPNPAQRRNTKIRSNTNQPADRILGFPGLPETGASERQNAIGKREIAVAIDRLARMCHGLFVPAGKQASQGAREGGVINERFPRA